LEVVRVFNWDGYPIGYLNGTSLNLNCVGFALNVPVPNPKANWAQARSATAAAELQSSTLVTCQSWMPIIKTQMVVGQNQLYIGKHQNGWDLWMVIHPKYLNMIKSHTCRF
jgi:hypothetical protein